MSEIIITTECVEDVENCEEVDEDSEDGSSENIVKFIKLLGDDDSDEKRHYSDPGEKPKRTNLGRHKHLSRSFAEFKNDRNNVRRLSIPEQKLLHQPALQIHHRHEKQINCPPKSILAGLLLAQQTLCPIITQDITPVPIPAPLVVEDPPSSDNVTSEEETTVRHNIDPVLLNGSSGSFGSAGARSAPSTPHGVGGASPGGSLHAPESPHSQPCSPSYTSTVPIPRSPSHIFGKYDKCSIKNLSHSEPTMTAQPRPPEPPSPKGAKTNKPVTSSRARQKKFQKHFKVDNEEKVENYYSCALVGDILLQGHLYITKNYFAFYSNVFGYVTKLLIPLSIVKEIQKEKTARIIPNAVGVYTTDNKHHTFGSLMSREATYQHMLRIKKQFDQHIEEVELDKQSEVELDEVHESVDTGDGETSSNSGNDSPSLISRRAGKILPVIEKIPPSTDVDGVEKLKITMKTHDTDRNFTSSLCKLNVFLLVSTLLLLLLFTSAGILLYRISRIQNRYTLGFKDSLEIPNTEIYNEILHWQSQLHTKSAGAVHNFLDTNLDQIAKVRKSLEALSTLLIPSNPQGSQVKEPEHRSETPPETNTHEESKIQTSYS